MNPLEAASAILDSFQSLSNSVQQQQGWESRRARIKAKADLGYHHIGFKDTLELLLGPFVDEDTELEELCRIPGHEKWRNRGLDDAIRQVYIEEGKYELIKDNLELMGVFLEDIQNGLIEVSVVPE